MQIFATPLVVGAGIALTSDDQEITVMLRPGEIHTVSDRMRHARSIRHAIQLGYIIVQIDATISDTLSGTHSDFVAQVELNALAALVSGVSGMFSSFSGFSGSTGIQKTKYMYLDIHGAADTAEIREIAGTPYLVFRDKKQDNSVWNISIPDDYVSGTSLDIEVYWSPNDISTGNVKWLLEYKAVTSGSSVATPMLLSSFVQASPGTAQQLTTTGTALSVPSGSFAANDLISLEVRRVGTDSSDTFTGQAWVHLVRVRYRGMGFS
jgi:hypothetical protein